MSQFPNQKLTKKEKIKEHGSIEDWAKSVYDSISGINSTSGGSSDYPMKEVLMDLAKGILNIQDFDYVTKPYGDSSPTYPAEFRHYDRISAKLHLLIGEEIKRPFEFKAVATNAEAVTVAEEFRQKMVVDSLQQQLTQQIQQLTGQEPQEGEEPMSIKQIEEYMGVSYKDASEIQANMALNYLKEYCDIEEKFIDGWEAMLTTGDDIYYTGTAYNEPILRNVDQRYFNFDRSPHVKYIEDAQWCLEERWIPASAIYEEYGEFLNEDDIDDIEKIKGTYGQNIGYGSGVPVIYMNGSNEGGSNRSSGYIEQSSSSIVRAVHLCWVGLRKVGFVSYQDDETGEVLEKKVDEDYSKNPEDLGIEWKWLNEVQEAIILGEDKVINVRPRPNQYRSMDNPNKVRLPYTGIADQSLSIVNRVKEIQYLYDIVMYRQELAMARAKGKLMVMDTAQIPTSQGMSMEQWLYYADTSGFAFINSMEEGTTGMSQGQRASFNQFNQIDLTLSNTLQQYEFVLNKLDHLMEDITGVTPQRQGQVSQYETQGGIERSVVQSSAITEFLFYKHNRVKRRVLSNLLEECKLCWMEGKKTQYVMDDMTRQIINIDGEIFNNSEHGVFVTDNKKADKIEGFIEANAQAAIQNQQVAFEDVVALLETDSVAAKKSILKKGKERQQQMQQQQAQQENEQAQQMQQQQLEAQRQMAQEDREDKQAHEIEKETLKGEFMLKGKEIDSFKFAEDQDVNNNNIPDQLEVEKLRAGERNDVRKNAIEEKKLVQKDKELDIKKQDLAAKRNKKTT